MLRATGGEDDVKVTSERGIRRGVMGTLAAAGMCLMLAGAARGQAAATAASGTKPVMAEQYFKNVQVLKGIPVDEFLGTMGFIAASLRVNCTEWHSAAGRGVILDY